MAKFNPGCPDGLCFRFKGKKQGRDAWDAEMQKRHNAKTAKSNKKEVKK